MTGWPSFTHVEVVETFRAFIAGASPVKTTAVLSMSKNQSAPVCRPMFSFSLAIGLLGVLGAGCASQNVNPAKPHAHTGYVDFIAEEDDHSWHVQEVDKSGKLKEVIAHYSPLNDRILRLAFAPGQHQLRVTFFNQVVKEPGVVDVEVKAGMITPVRVKFEELGTTLLATKSTQASGTFYGRFGRATKLRANEAETYRVKLEPGEDIPYRVKQETPYASAPAK